MDRPVGRSLFSPAFDEALARLAIIGALLFIVYIAYHIARAYHIETAAFYLFLFFGTLGLITRFLAEDK